MKSKSEPKRFDEYLFFTPKKEEINLLLSSLSFSLHLLYRCNFFILPLYLSRKNVSCLFLVCFLAELFQISGLLQSSTNSWHSREDSSLLHGCTNECPAVLKMACLSEKHTFEWNLLVPCLNRIKENEIYFSLGCPVHISKHVAIQT